MRDYKADVRQHDRRSKTLGTAGHFKHSSYSVPKQTRLSGPRNRLTKITMLPSPAAITSLLFLAFCPPHTSAIWHPKFPNPLNLPDPADTDPTQKHHCAPDASSPSKDQVKEVSGRVRANINQQPVANNFDRQCTLVFAWNNAAVYICNRNGMYVAGSMVPYVIGKDIADAIDSIVDDPACTSTAGGAERVGGTAWLDGPLFWQDDVAKQSSEGWTPGSEHKAQGDAPFILLVQGT